MRTPKRHLIHCNSIDLNVYEWPGVGSPYLFVHATGFHARCWDQVIRHLPDTAHIYAVDLRCHGLSQKTEPPYSWDLFGNDICELITALNLQELIAVGHSLGGHLVTLAAAQHPDRIKQLILFDPTIMDPEIVNMLRDADFDHPVAKRRANWASVTEMLEKLSLKNPYQHWDAKVLKDYCRYALVENTQNNNYTLACAPHMEAAIYACSGGEKIFSVLDSIEIKVRMIRARARHKEDSILDFAPSPTWAELPNVFRHVDDTQLKNLSHFFPMEVPEQVAKWIIESSEM